MSYTAESEALREVWKARVAAAKAVDEADVAKASRLETEKEGIRRIEKQVTDMAFLVEKQQETLNSIERNVIAIIIAVLGWIFSHY